ncbi:hypothetical protein SCHPADRAFT_932606 [Schizopora paradoxa]|uniref:Uncharacterized protein n=1 Tax=Schizopora paradoxa TaxID=27342 RepID=A0A0H2RCG5_9AGAM|nr:hypothetical protein SCHPADRAFT_932606 [Schizopora paradoxa]
MAKSAKKRAKADVLRWKDGRRNEGRTKGGTAKKENMKESRKGIIDAFRATRPVFDVVNAKVRRRAVSLSKQEGEQSEEEAHHIAIDIEALGDDPSRRRRWRCCCWLSRWASACRLLASSSRHLAFDKSGAKKKWTAIDDAFTGRKLQIHILRENLDDKATAEDRVPHPIPPILVLESWLRHGRYRAVARSSLSSTRDPPANGFQLAIIRRNYFGSVTIIQNWTPIAPKCIIETSLSYSAFDLETVPAPAREGACTLVGSQIFDTHAIFIYLSKKQNYRESVTGSRYYNPEISAIRRRV